MDDIRAEIKYKVLWGDFMSDVYYYCEACSESFCVMDYNKDSNPPPDCKFKKRNAEWKVFKALRVLSDDEMR